MPSPLKCAYGDGVDFCGNGSADRSLKRVIPVAQEYLNQGIIEPKFHCGKIQFAVMVEVAGQSQPTAVEGVLWGGMMGSPVMSRTTRTNGGEVSGDGLVAVHGRRIHSVRPGLVVD